MQQRSGVTRRFPIANDEDFLNNSSPYFFGLYESGTIKIHLMAGLVIGCYNFSYQCGDRNVTIQGIHRPNPPSSSYFGETLIIKIK